MTQIIKVVQNDKQQTPDNEVQVPSKAELSLKDEVVVAIKSLIDSRKDWENTVYRKSNDALYSILQRCYAIDYAMTGNDKDAKQRRAGLAEMCAQIGYRAKESTPTITKVVKCVFGDIARSRICTYSLVLREARKRKIAITAIPAFIEENGGVEQIRLSKSPAHKTAQQKATLALPAVTSDVLGVVHSQALSERADAKFVDTQCVLIATQQADGNFAINAVVRSNSALTAALVSYYGSSSATRKDVAAKQEAANDSDIRTKIIRDIANRK